MQYFECKKEPTPFSGAMNPCLLSIVRTWGRTIQVYQFETKSRVCIIRSPPNPRRASLCAGADQVKQQTTQVQVNLQGSVTLGAKSQVALNVRVSLTSSSSVWSGPALPTRLAGHSPHTGSHHFGLPHAVCPERAQGPPPPLLLSVRVPLQSLLEITSIATSEPPPAECCVTALYCRRLFTAMQPGQAGASIRCLGQPHRVIIIIGIIHSD